MLNHINETPLPKPKAIRRYIERLLVFLFANSDVYFDFTIPCRQKILLAAYDHKISSAAYVFYIGSIGERVAIDETKKSQITIVWPNISNE